MRKFVLKRKRLPRRLAGTAFSCRQTLHRNFSRADSHLSKSPHKQAEIIQRLVTKYKLQMNLQKNRATPRKELNEEEKTWLIEFLNRSLIVAPWCISYPYCTTSFKKAWTQVLRRFISCSRRVRDLRWWGSLTMVPAGNKAKRLSSVNNTTKTNYHHHYPISYTNPGHKDHVYIGKIDG